MTEIDQNNPLQTSRFNIILSRRAKNTSFYCKGTSIPGVSASNPEVGRPRYSTPALNDTLSFEDLVCQIILTEDMSSYMEMRDWLEQCTQLVQQDSNDYFEDLEIVIYSSYNNPLRRFTFLDGHPKAIGSIELNSSNDELDAITFNVTFGYSHFNVT